MRRSSISISRRFSILDQGDAGGRCQSSPHAAQVRTREAYPRGSRRYNIDLFPGGDTLTPVTDILKEDYPHYEDFLEEILKLQSAFEQYKGRA